MSGVFTGLLHGKRKIEKCKKPFLRQLADRPLKREELWIRIFDI